MLIKQKNWPKRPLFRDLVNKKHTLMQRGVTEAIFCWCIRPKFLYLIADCKLCRRKGKQLSEIEGSSLSNNESDKIASDCSMACCLLNLMKFVRSSDRGPETAEIYKNFKNTGAKCPNLIMHVWLRFFSSPSNIVKQICLPRDFSYSIPNHCSSSNHSSPKSQSGPISWVY